MYERIAFYLQEECMPPMTNKQAPLYHQKSHITRKPIGALQVQRWLGKPRSAIVQKRDISPHRTSIWQYET